LSKVDCKRGQKNSAINAYAYLLVTILLNGSSTQLQHDRERKVELHSAISFGFLQGRLLDRCCCSDLHDYEYVIGYYGDTLKQFLIRLNFHDIIQLTFLEK
jgi:hypothetical protein